MCSSDLLGSAPAAARVHPCLEWHGDLLPLLDQLGAEGVVQLLVEGGPNVAGSFHRSGLVDRYILHMAPALMGDAPHALTGIETPTITDLWRGRVIGVRQLGDDIEVVMEPTQEQ